MLILIKQNYNIIMNKKFGNQTERFHYHLPSTNNLFRNELDSQVVKILQNNHSKRTLGMSNIPNIQKSPNFQKSTSSKKNKHIHTEEPDHKNINHNSILKDTLKILHNRKQNKCKINSHENSKLMYLCTSEVCNENERLGCAHCFIECHKNHQKVKVDDFLKDFTKNYLNYLQDFEQFLRCIRNMKQKQERSLEAQFQLLKNNFQIHLQRLKSKLVFQLKRQLNTRLSKQYKILSNSQNFFKTLNQLQRMQTKHPFQSSLTILIQMKNEQRNPTVKQGIKHLKKFQHQDINIINSTYFQNLNNSINQLFYINKNIDQNQLIQYDSMSHIEKSISKIILSKNNQNIHTHHNNLGYTMAPTQSDLSNNNKQVLKICNQTGKYFINPQYIQYQHLPSILQNINRQYVNTLSYFKCCDGLYCCVNCHNQIQRHNTNESVPSTRLCLNCKQEIEVPYVQSIPINCKSCLKKNSKSGLDMNGGNHWNYQ